jgi:anti-sigma regulatory factor (Ser/Thr protein kinase)
MAAEAPPAPSAAGSQHHALLYEDASGFLDGAAPFVRHGVDAGERVLVAVTAERRGWLREALGTDLEGVEWAEAESVYRRHGPMLTTMMEFLARHTAPGGRVRILAEQALATRPPAHARAYLRYEAAANVAYQPFAASVLCPYDVSRLPDAVVAGALRTHPQLLEGARSRPSEAFVDPRAFVRDHARAEPPPCTALSLELERIDDVPRARHWLAGLAATQGLAAAKVQELEVAVSEIVTNALIHGEAPRCLWVYRRDGALVCHVRDGGAGPADPLVGYQPPDIAALGGRGLWIAHQLCDVVEVAANGNRTDVCLHMTL